MAFYRRYIEKLVRLKRNFKSGLVLIFIGGLMCSVLLGNGMNMIWHGDEAIGQNLSLLLFPSFSHG